MNKYVNYKYYHYYTSQEETYKWLGLEYKFCYYAFLNQVALFKFQYKKAKTSAYLSDTLQRSNGIWK